MTLLNVVPTPKGAHEVSDVLASLEGVLFPPRRETSPKRDVQTIRETTKRYIDYQNPPIPMHRILDFDVPVVNGRIRVRIFYPTAERGGPAVIHLHGGGWVAGDLQIYDRPTRRLAQSILCPVVLVEYRLAPEYCFPTPLNDCVTAIRWVYSNSSALDIDGQRLGVIGDSAGGQLAAAACLILQRDPELQIAFQALIYPVVDHSSRTFSYTEFESGFGLTRATMSWNWNQYLLPGTDRTDPRISPISSVGISTTAAANFVATAEFDILRDAGELYAHQLAAVRRPVQLRRYNGTIHGFFLLDSLFPQSDVMVGHLAHAATTAFAI
ncbi:acetyl esterase [Rhodococcus sp. UYP5]|uniref:alpha/beta hydrolase n=2 Tax=unclassified Rhodococcus (in: high G+C Gram-positive bacteria) TaxID=192944 RepID=UPI0033941421